MHDKHGREIRLGDTVLAPRRFGGATGAYQLQPARVVRLTPDATSCNVQAEYAAIAIGTFTAKECEVIFHADGPLEPLAPAEPSGSIPADILKTE